MATTEKKEIEVEIGIVLQKSRNPLRDLIKLVYKANYKRAVNKKLDS